MLLHIKLKYSWRVPASSTSIEGERGQTVQPHYQNSNKSDQIDFQHITQGRIRRFPVHSKVNTALAPISISSAAQAANRFITQHKPQQLRQQDPDSTGPHHYRHASGAVHRSHRSAGEDHSCKPEPNPDYCCLGTAPRSGSEKIE